MIKEVTITNVKGIKVKKFRFTDGPNFIVGDYGTGKTSLVRAIEWAIVGGWDAKQLLRTGESAMSVNIVLSDGAIVNRSYSKIGSGPTTTVVTMREKPSRAREWLQKNVARYFISNTGYSLLAKEKRYEAFMATVPTLDEEEVVSLIPKELRVFVTGIDYSLPAPVVVKKIVDKLNAVKKSQNAALSDLKSVLSADVRNLNEFEYEVEIDRLREELERLDVYRIAVPHNVEAEIEKLIEDTASLHKRLEETEEALKKSAPPVITQPVDHCPLGLECGYSPDELMAASRKVLKNADIVASLREVRDGLKLDIRHNEENIKQLKQMLADGITSKKLYDELYGGMKEKKERYEYELRLFRKSQDAIEKIDKYEDSVVKIEETVTKLKELVKNMDVKPNIDKIAIKGKTVYYDSIPLTESCGTEQLITVARLARELTPARIFIVDDADLLTKKSYHEILDVLKGWQILFVVHSDSEEVRVTNEWRWNDRRD